MVKLDLIKKMIKVNSIMVYSKLFAIIISIVINFALHYWINCMIMEMKNKRIIFK